MKEIRTKRQKDTNTESCQKGRKTERQKDGKKERQKDRKKERQKERQKTKTLRNVVDLLFTSRKEVIDLQNGIGKANHFDTHVLCPKPSIDYPGTRVFEGF